VLGNFGEQVQAFFAIRLISPSADGNHNGCVIERKTPTEVVFI
jgi:hypothetical protein